MPQELADALKSSTHRHMWRSPYTSRQSIVLLSRGFNTFHTNKTQARLFLCYVWRIFKTIVLSDEVVLQEFKIHSNDTKKKKKKSIPLLHTEVPLLHLPSSGYWTHSRVTVTIINSLPHVYLTLRNQHLPRPLGPGGRGRTESIKASSVSQ